MVQNAISTRLYVTGVVTVVLTVITCARAHAQSDAESASQINKANELVRQGRYVDAIDAYGNTQIVKGQNDQLNYNLAIAHYRNGDVQAAASLFEAAAVSTDSSIAANSRYNLGNCQYSVALQSAEQDKQVAVENLRSAISYYRASLRIDRNNADARANIELASELIKKLEEQQQQEQQQQNQEQQNQDQQNQEQPNQDQPNQDQPNQEQQSKEQQSKEQQSKEQQSQEQQSQEQENQDQQDKGEPSEKSESSSDEQESQSKDEKQSGDQDSNQDETQQQQNNSDGSKEQESDSKDSNTQNQQSRNEQGANQDNNENQRARSSRNNEQKSGDAPEEQDPGDQDPVPTGELEAAGQQDKDGKKATMVGERQDKDGLMTREEALKMLQSVRDRDMLRRLRQQQRQRSRRLPVDRDW